MIRDGLTFDDVLLVPKHSTIGSRSQVDVFVKLGDWQFKHPLIPANMATIMGRDMAEAVIKSGGLAILHRFMPFQDQLNLCSGLMHNYGNSNISVSIGVKPEDKKNIKHFHDTGVKIVCIDIANGDADNCLNMVKYIREEHPSMFIIAGNVATGEGAGRLWKAGADAVRCGVGNGSICTTRIMTGNGVPQLTALMDVLAMKKKMTGEDEDVIDCTVNPPVVRKMHSQMDHPIYIIADGGCKTVGDVVKSLCFADMVMSGNMFAGCVEVPGKMLVINGEQYKEYAGSSTHRANHVEGVAALVKSKGTYESVLTKVLEGVRSGCSYQNARNLDELKEDPEFIRITNAGWRESNAHDVILQ